MKNAKSYSVRYMPLNHPNLVRFPQQPSGRAQVLTLGILSSLGLISTVLIGSNCPTSPQYSRPRSEIESALHFRPLQTFHAADIMIVMEHPEGGNEDTTQKRKRRPKSYQGCTQCRLARRKCGEGMSCIIQHETLVQELRQPSTYLGIVTILLELLICFFE